ncbi:condensation domain-containing protein [Nonomuraea fuscirosea]|uniref:condensation domain-containing protein n=1 Tax=Nonomuraea fuscirosea TaxID=1291556 RepID=UPI00343BDAE3
MLYEVCWLTGKLDLAAVRDAWWRVCLRHDVMRRTYASADEACTHDDALSEVEFHTAATDAEATEKMRRILGTPFDLSGPAFSRIVIVQRSERRHLLGIAVDHIISDQISWFFLCGEFAALYERALTGEAGDTAERGPYRSFASRLRRDFPGAWGEKRREFWRAYTAEFGVFPPPFSAGTQHRGEEALKVVERGLPVDVRAKAHALSRRAGATPFAVVASGMLAGMCEVSGDQVVGLTTHHHGRTAPGTYRTIGLFTQAVPLHLRSRPENPLETVRDVFLRSLDVTEYILPLRVAGNLWSENLMAPGREAGVFVSLEEDEPPSGLQLAGTSAQHVEMRFPGAKRLPETIVVDWSLHRTGPRVTASYNEGVFPTAFVEQILQAAEKFVLSEGNAW